MKNKIDVLNLEWASIPYRDREAATLVCNYLRYMGYSVIEKSVFNGFYYIDKYKPRLFFINCTKGADINYRLLKYAKSRGCLAVSLIAEGNFKRGKSFVTNFVWGWNKDRILYEDYYLLWSEWTRKLALKYFPEIESKLKVSGYVGIDKHKILKPVNIEILLNKNNIKVYKKIIGVGCWNFNYFYPKNINYYKVKEKYSNEIIKRFRSDGIQFNQILRTIVKENKDILFILKQHPSICANKLDISIQDLNLFKNVLIINNEENITNCISVCDFWIIYNSTTALEAWLLNKQTCLINPSGTDFPRDNLYKGSPNYNTQERLQNAINYFYKNNKLPGFDMLNKNRKKLIKDIIQWDDGLNHIRAGNEIIDLLKKNKSVYIKKAKLRKRINNLKHNILWHLLPYIKYFSISKYFWQKRNMFDENQVKIYSKSIMQKQIDFYKQLGLTKKKLREINCI